MSKTTLSPIIAGAMNWGIWDKNLNTKEMDNIIHLCLENKITTFDHADIYGGYTTEAAFGKAFASSKIDRESLEFISKCGIQHVSENRNNKIKHYDYSKDYLIWSVENSLKNLQTDYLDVLLLHRPSPLMQADEIAEAVTKLKSEGKRVTGYGATSKSTTILNYSDIGPDLIEYICDNTPIKQGKYSPGKHIPIELIETFRQNYPDYSVLFAYNHAKEIMDINNIY